MVIFLLPSAFVYLANYSGNYSFFRLVPPWSSKEEPLRIADARFFYRSDALPLSQPAVSKH